MRCNVYISGVESLIRNKVYTGAFPLHEVCIFLLCYKYQDAYELN